VSKAQLAVFLEGIAMKLPRRQFLHLAAGAAALPALSRIARAQAYPTRPVRLIVGFAPGGTTDIVARLMGQRLSERMGQPFIIENRPGAASNLGTEAVVTAPPDGHTLLVVTTTNAINAALYYKLNFNFIRDVASVAGVVRAPNVMEVHPSVPAKTVPEFITFAKANPGKISMASPGAGTPAHVAGELFKMMAAVDLVHVPYRGAALALNDLLGGHVQIQFDALPSSIEHIRAGRLRALAVTTAARSEALPDVPTVREFVPGYEASGWFGIGAPRNTPQQIIEKINTEINAALADPEIARRLAELGGTTMAGSPADFRKLIVDDTEKWEKVIRGANIKAE
jgi:tripartite-type tricarboxylate transporter receptor subunit TctC